jgi:hypothetical protein
MSEVSTPTELFTTDAELRPEPALVGIFASQGCRLPLATIATGFTALRQMSDDEIGLGTLCRGLISGS